MRNYSIDTLKFVCAILIVLLHTSTPYSYLYLPLTRCAVPVFFMISGYMLYGQEMSKRLKRGIGRTLKIIAWSTLLYAVFSFMLSKGDFQNVIPTKEQLRDLFLFNVNPWGGHLWYLNAYLYVMLIMIPLSKRNVWRWLLLLIIPLLCIDLAFGKYSLLIIGREYDYIYVRNFLCVGIPYFLIGVWVKKYNPFEWLNSKLAMGGVILFSITSFAEFMILDNLGLNATRDHYISSTLLSFCLFLMFERHKQYLPTLCSELGRKDSLYVYIIHPIWISIFIICCNHIPAGLSMIIRYSAPMLVIGFTFLTIYSYRKLKALK